MELFNILINDNYEDNLNKKYFTHNKSRDLECIVKEYENNINVIIKKYDEKIERLNNEIANLSNDIQTQVGVICNYDKQLIEMTEKYNSAINNKEIVYVNVERTVVGEIVYLIKRIIKAVKRRVIKLFKK